MKQLLSDPRGNVLIEDSDGNQVMFDTWEEFEFYVGIDPTTYKDVYINYEPMRYKHSHRTELDIVTEYPIPFPPFENVINNLSVYQARVSDPYYGLTGQDLIDKQADVALREAEQARYEAAVAARDADGMKGLTVEQITNYVNNRVDGAATTADKIEVFKELIIKLAIRTLT